MRVVFLTFLDFGEEGEPTILAGARYAELLLQFAGPLYAKAPLVCKRWKEALDLLLRMKARSVWGLDLTTLLQGILIECSGNMDWKNEL